MAPKSANDTIRHAVIGCRIRGRVHAKEFAGKPGVEMTHVCDPDSQLANELADAVERQQGRAPKAVQDLRQVFDDKTVDTVSSPRRNHWHALAAIWAMQAGKDVYVEKPVCHNVSEGRRMVQVSRKTGRICQGGHNIAQQRRERAGRGVHAAGQARRGEAGAEHRVRRPRLDRRAGQRTRFRRSVDYNLFRPGAAGSADAEESALRLALGVGHRQRRIGQQQRPLARHLPLGPGRDGPGPRGHQLRRPPGLQRRRPDAQHAGLHFRFRRQDDHLRDARPEDRAVSSRGPSGGTIFEGTKGIIAGSSVFDLEGKLVSTFDGKSENHFANFLTAVRSRKREDQKAEILEGHQSASLCHIGNISWRLGKTASPEEIRAELTKLKAHDNWRSTRSTARCRTWRKTRSIWKRRR